jgi:hypothetical protein
MKAEELNKKAQEFLNDRGLDSCYATEDGNLFLEEGYAKAHAVKNGIGCVKIEATEEVVKEKKK